jgi:hypothetical protein
VVSKYTNSSKIEEKLRGELALDGAMDKNEKLALARKKVRVDL